MCGRFQLTLTMEDLVNFLEILEEVDQRYKESTLAPYVQEKREVYPGQETLILSKEGFKKLTWGFPYEKKLVFNAREETLFQKSFFSQSARSRRCLVPANLFYEWQGKEKIKHLITTEDPLFFMGGIFSAFPTKEGQIKEHFSIITKASRGPMEKIHPRSPVLVEKEEIKRFLDPETPQQDIQELLTRTPRSLLIAEAPRNQQLSFF